MYLKQIKIESRVNVWNQWLAALVMHLIIK
jgi:hypothetical protein